MRVLLLIPLLAGVSMAAEQKLGKPLASDKPLAISTVLEKPANYVGKVVQVKGKVTEVCQKAGCWMMLVDPASAKSLRVKVNDGEIVFPKEAVGRTALAEGKLMKIVMTKEQAIERARHEAEEQGRKFDPASITKGSTMYQIQGTGAVLLD